MHRALAGQSIPPAVGVASALRSSAGANKYGVAAHRPSPMLDRPGVAGKVAQDPHIRRQSVPTVLGLNYLIGMSEFVADGDTV